MQIHVSPEGIFIPRFRFRDEPTEMLDELEEWLDRLCVLLEEAFKNVHYDLSLGTSKHRVLSSVPSSSDIEEGEIVFYDDGTSTRRLYTKLNGNLRYVDLT